MSHRGPERLPDVTTGTVMTIGAGFRRFTANDTALPRCPAAAVAVALTVP